MLGLTHLDRLLLRRFAFALVSACVMLVALYLLVHLSADAPRIPGKMERLEKVGENGLWGIARYYLLLGPLVLQMAFPYAVMTSGLWVLQGMRRRREFLIYQLSGISTERATRPLLLATLILGVLSGVARERVLPELQLAFRGLESRVKGRRSDVLRELDVMRDRGGGIIHVAAYESETRVARGVQLLADRGRPGATGTWDELRYRQDGLQGPGWYAPDAAQRAPFELDPDRLALSASAGRLLRYDDLRRLAEESATRRGALLALNLLYASPLVPFVLLLLGIALWQRLQTTAPMAALGLGVAIALGSFTLQRLFESLGRRDFVTPELAAWLPVLLPGLAAFGTWRDT